MPHLNHTGPEGEGPKTGRKLGNALKQKLKIRKPANSGKDLENAVMRAVAREKRNALNIINH